MKIDPVKQAPVPAISGEDPLATVPDVAKHARVEVKNVSNVPSDYMDPPRWIALTKEVAAALQRPEVAGVIISHGTDTLEETAWWLDLTVNSDKPIILIGAQRNASRRILTGPEICLTRCGYCVDHQSGGKGAMIALNGQINAARDVTKTHTSSVETFKSGDFGFLGVVDQDRVIFARAPLRRQHIPLKTDEPNKAGIKAIAAQQFEWGKQILAHGLVPILEPEVDIKSPNKAECEKILKQELLAGLDGLKEGQQVIFKLTIPDQDDFYADLVKHPKVARVVALSGGYTRERCLREALSQPRHDRFLQPRACRGPDCPAERRRVQQDAEGRGRQDLPSLHQLVAPRPAARSPKRPADKLYEPLP